MSNIGEPVQLEFAEGVEQLNQAESCILPAGIGEVRIIPDQQASLVVCYVPDLQLDIIQPLQSAGYSNEQIRELGEVH